MTILKIGVIGAGQMGAGIAQEAARAGCVVTVTDLDNRHLASGRQAVEKSLIKFAQKGKLPEGNIVRIIDQITWSVGLDHHRDADIVIEAVTESEEIKKAIFAGLHSICPAETIFASNTSSLSITRLAAASGRAEKFIGLHFMNPVPLMELVEIIRGEKTSDETYKAVKELAERMEKTTVLSKDTPAFIVNRILLTMINEAFYLLQEETASAEDIDTAMKSGANLPMGPLTLADYIGLDTVLSVLKVMHGEFKNDKYRPCPLLRGYVASNKLGRKTGGGVYEYELPSII